MSGLDRYPCYSSGLPCIRIDPHSDSGSRGQCMAEHYSMCISLRKIKVRNSFPEPHPRLPPLSHGLELNHVACGPSCKANSPAASLKSR